LVRAGHWLGWQHSKQPFEHGNVPDGQLVRHRLLAHPNAPQEVVVPSWQLPF
jgi:hypothetical protein